MFEDTIVASAAGPSARKRTAKRGEMRETFRDRYLGVMDYYRMKNVHADTMMRHAINCGEDGSSGPKACGLEIVIAPCRW